MFLFKPKPSTYSRIHNEIKVGKSFGKKALIAGGIPQSGGEFIHMWDSVFKNVSNISGKTCLLLGVGGGDVIKSLLTYYPEFHITGVEIDPVIIDIAKKEFGLIESDKTEIIISDAIEWIKKNKKTYDLIVVDLFIGIKNPPKSRTRSFMKLLNKSLKRKGTVIMNTSYSVEDNSTFRTFEKISKSQFKNMEIVFEYKYNKVIVLYK